VLLQLYVDGLIVSHIHKMQGSAALANHLEIRCILGVVKPAEFAVVDAEAVLPEVEDAFLWLIVRSGRLLARDGFS